MKNIIKTKNKYLLSVALLLGALFLGGIYSGTVAQTGDIIPTACADATYTLDPGTTIHFYDDGGPGGNCSTDGAAGNFANAGCETVTTICAAPGEFLSVDFIVFSMFATNSGFDWMVIYEGANTSGTILFDNRNGGPNNPQGTSCEYTGGLDLCAIGCITFRFYASSVVNREGWDAVVTSSPPTGTGLINLDIAGPTCTTDGSVVISNYDNTATYTFTPAGPSIGASGEITGAVFGQFYTVEIGSGGCSGSATFQIEEQLNNPTISVPTTMCGNGDTQTLVGDPVGGTWSSSNTTVATVDPSGVVTSVGDGTTTITYDLAGCSQTVVVTVDPGVVPSFDPIPDFCENTTSPILPLTSINGISGTWSPAIVSNSAGTSSYTFTPDPNGCGTMISVDVNVLSEPNFTLSAGHPTGCGFSDGSVSINGLLPNTTYSVTYEDASGNTIGPTNLTSNGTGSIIVANLISGTYSGFMIDLNGCTGINNTSVILVDSGLPIVNAGQDTEVCEGQQVTFTASNPDGAVLSWSNGVIDGQSFTPPVGTTIYTVSADLAGCVSTDQVSVTVSPNPIVNAGSDINACEGQQITLSGTGAATYTWDNGVIDGQSFTPPSGTTIYIVIGTDAFGCTGQDEVTVNVSNSMDVSFTANNDKGCAPLEVSFSNTTVGNGTCTYTLGNGTVLNSCNPTHTFTQPGCHDVTLTVLDSQGCLGSVTESNMICVDSQPVASFVANPSALGVFSNEVKFTNTTNGGSTYEWDFGDGEISGEVNPTHEYELEEDHYIVNLIAISEFGCRDTVSTIIEVLEELIYYIPNTFTPDGNNVNQTFKPVFTSGFDPEDYHITIFNRWGEKMFESHDTEYGWDGTYGINGGRIVQEGVYVYKIEFKNINNEERVELVGHVNLIR